MSALNETNFPSVFPTESVSEEKKKPKQPVLPPKYMRYKVFSYWLINQLKEKEIINEESTKQVHDLVGLFSDVESQTEFYKQFESEFFKETKKTMTKEISIHNKPPKKTSSKKTKADNENKPKVSRKKKTQEVEVIVSNVSEQDDLYNQLIAPQVSSPSKEINLSNDSEVLPLPPLPPVKEDKPKKSTKKSKASSVEESIVEPFNQPNELIPLTPQKETKSLDEPTAPNAPKKSSKKSNTSSVEVSTDETSKQPDELTSQKESKAKKPQKTPKEPKVPKEPKTPKKESKAKKEPKTPNAPKKSKKSDVLIEEEMNSIEEETQPNRPQTPILPENKAEDEDDEETLTLKTAIVNGKEIFYDPNDGCVYDINTQEVIGIYDINTHTITDAIEE